MASKAVSNELSKTERLNGTNFSTWKRRIKHILFQDKIQYVLDVPMPTEPPANAGAAARRTYERFIDDDKTVKSTMLTFMDPDLEIIYEGQPTARDMFEAVTQAYGGQSETYIQLLIEKFNTSRMKDTDSVIDHCSRMTVIAKELASTGHPIPDKMQVSTVLHSLPLSWDPVVVSINMSGREVTMNNLPKLLGIEAQRREKRNETSQTQKGESSQVNITE
ncbi:hypothetical protein AQUCO_01600350v1 [Aquilegia coerulea]|uniref:Retrotransposon Copia-like N-terminal domain-containing protein n=1 Tax=Aquilegia coerulea TaxID=218851 RepID=A0A2G5DR88_AQUCA|nr:hypothetical protein AQUCO_01600350v1 [Aquilegia coerulea]